MAREDIRKALGASLKAEEQSIQSRFEKAEALLSPKKAAPKPSAKPKPRPAKKERVIRDSFTMPKSDYELLAELKKRAIKLGLSATKSELVRAGLRSLTQLSDERLTGVIEKLDKVKTGRPAQSAEEFVRYEEY